MDRRSRRRWSRAPTRQVRREAGAAKRALAATNGADRRHARGVVTLAAAARNARPGSPLAQALVGGTRRV